MTSESNDRHGPILGLSLSRQGLRSLALLKAAGVVTDLAAVDARPASVLTHQWREASAFVVAGAIGAVTRLIAPLITDKSLDPAVVVIDPAGLVSIPLLGGHEAGGEALSQAVAACLGGSAIRTGSSGSDGNRLPLDCFGLNWGWRRGAGPWDQLMRRAARALPVGCHQECGLDLWRRLPSAVDGSEVRASPRDSNSEAGSCGQAVDLVISACRGEGCRWHPPVLWVGLGCERGTSKSLIERATGEALSARNLAPEAVAGMATLDLKGDEAGLLALATTHDWPLRLFPADQLAPVPVPSPSAHVARTVGTHSVAEAAALLAAGDDADLLVSKCITRAVAGEQGAVTVAIAACHQQRAPDRGRLDCVGGGPGALDLLTASARVALAQATVWVGYGLYLDLLEPLRRLDQLRLDGRLTQEQQRCDQALELACRGLRVALVSSGDSGLYGMAGLALSLWLRLPVNDRPEFLVHPGISAFQLAAARVGAPLMHDLCIISLSDRLTPWSVIRQRLEGAAHGDFVVALYNPRSPDRSWQLAEALAILLRNRSGHTPVLLARQLGRDGEHLSLHRLASVPVETVDMLTLVLVGNSSTRLEEGVMVTPRGYPGAEIGA